MYRWYRMDPIRYQKSLRVQIRDQRYQNRQIPSQDDLVSGGRARRPGAPIASRTSCGESRSNLPRIQVKL
jgi:hypothetical protein